MPRRVHQNHRKSWQFQSTWRQSSQPRTRSDRGEGGPGGHRRRAAGDWRGCGAGEVTLLPQNPRLLSNASTHLPRCLPGLDINGVNFAIGSTDQIPVMTVSKLDLSACPKSGPIVKCETWFCEESFYFVLRGDKPFRMRLDKGLGGHDTQSLLVLPNTFKTHSIVKNVIAQSQPPQIPCRGEETKWTATGLAGESRFQEAVYTRRMKNLVLPSRFSKGPGGGCGPSANNRHVSQPLRGLGIVHGSGLRRLQPDPMADPHLPFRCLSEEGLVTG